MDYQNRKHLTEEKGSRKKNTYFPKWKDKLPKLKGYSEQNENEDKENEDDNVLKMGDFILSKPEIKFQQMGCKLGLRREELELEEFNENCNTLHDEMLRK